MWEKFGENPGGKRMAPGKGGWLRRKLSVAPSLLWLQLQSLLLPWKGQGPTKIIKLRFFGPTILRHELVALPSFGLLLSGEHICESPLHTFAVSDFPEATPPSTLPLGCPLVGFRLFLVHSAVPNHLSPQIAVVPMSSQGTECHASLGNLLLSWYFWHLMHSDLISPANWVLPERRNQIPIFLWLIP